ncbi:MAG: hypothetical protein ABIJ33_03795 [Patescibacteria group bacterium]
MEKVGQAESAPSSNHYPTPPGIEMSEKFPGVVKPIPEKTIYEWTSPCRPFKKRRRQYFTTLGTIVLLLSLILFFAGQVLPVAVVLAVAFLAYTMSTIPPHNIKQKITTYGIRIEDQIFYWQELGRFWFEKKLGQDMLLVEVYRFPNRLSMMLGKEADQKELIEVLSEVLLQEKPELTTYDKAAKWLQEKIPLDIDGDDTPTPSKNQAHQASK